MCLGDHVNGGLVELWLRPVYDVNFAHGTALRAPQAPSVTLSGLLSHFSNFEIPPTTPLSQEYIYQEYH